MKKIIKRNIKIYNSITGKKEIFNPIIKGHVGMYVCGPTVYNKIHLGNCRTFIHFDLIFRYFKYLGYKVRYVRNITDVGHLENDNDEGEDKIGKKAKIEKLEPMEIVQKYTIDFHHTLYLFNILPPSIEPTATGHIIDQIEDIKILIKKGLAYEVNGSVYFNIEAYNKNYEYGILSKHKIDNLIESSRFLKKQQEKRNPKDFALWKKAPINHIMHWPSPWGNGFPSWHLECSTMSVKYLGKFFDIHGGGIDLKFPHHECELAQIKGIYNQKTINFWIHTNMLTLNGYKMSKSTMNILLPKDIFSGKNTFLEKPFHPNIVRFFILKNHYRSIINISNDALIDAERTYYSLMNKFKKLDNIYYADTDNVVSTFDVFSWKEECHKAMDDDFNSPMLISLLFKATKYIELLEKGVLKLGIDDFLLFKNTMHNFIFKVLGLEPIEKIDNVSKKLINLLIKIRNNARYEKNWILSDNIRNELKELGITLEDNKNITTFKIKT
ncbi:MAG: cysteine--tRNA ligase [Candidatus Bostrichicola ureolyticus]|nr:MAG: cysteine--tRNA ligase [Candidatus Bostrichicola ureolyticus]